MAKAKTASWSIGRLLLQIALGVMLIVGGILALQGSGDFANIFKNDILSKVFGVIELIAGVLLIIELFAGDRFGKFDNILMIIIMIVWCVAIVVLDFVNAKSILSLPWFYTLANHLIVLGAMLYLND